jgi:multiple sugar transport system permease protein
MSTMKKSLFLRHRIVRSLAATVRAVLLVCLAFVVVYPLIYLVSMSARLGVELIDPSVIWLPKHPTFETLQDATGFLKYPTTLLNSFVFSTLGTLLELAACSFTAYGFARFRFRGSRLLFGLLLFSIVVPVHTLLIPNFMQIRFFDFFGFGTLYGLVAGSPLLANLYNTPFAVFLPAAMGVGIRGGLFIYIFRQFFKGLPLDLEDAANIDGCGFRGTFLRVIIPSSQPPFLVVSILSFIWHWNDSTVLSMYWPKFTTLAVAVETISSRVTKGAEFFDIFVWQRAACLLLILPVLLLYLFVQRYFIQSVDRTGLK